MDFRMTNKSYFPLDKTKEAEDRLNFLSSALLLSLQQGILNRGRLTHDALLTIDDINTWR